MSKRAIVLRYASIGDAIQASSPMAELHDAGYFVHLVTSKIGEEVLRHDPHIDSIAVATPEDHFMEEYAKWLSDTTSGFDLVANLVYSVEGELLNEPANRDYYRPDAVRRALYGRVNYIEHQHILAQVPFHRNRQWFYETDRELGDVLKSIGPKITVGVVLSGSHPYKLWPHLPEFCVSLLQKHDVRLVFIGSFDATDLAAQEYAYQAIRREIGPLETSPIEIMSTLSAPLRTNLTMACHVDILIGPETGALNAAAMRLNHKIVMLSHSTADNLTRDWLNTVALSASIPCAPCHRLHHLPGDCPSVGRYKACADGISAAAVLAETEKAIAAVISLYRPASIAPADLVTPL